MNRMRLSDIGVWSSQLRYGAPAESAEAAVELEELGFTALWIPDVGGAVFDAVESLLAATTRTVIATGILNLWMHTPENVATSPLAATASFLDAIDATEHPVPVDRTAPAVPHPYLVTPEHTHQARTALGDGPLLLPEQTVILTDGADEARKIGTDWLSAYLALPNYANNTLRSGLHLRRSGAGQRSAVRLDHRLGRRSGDHAPGLRTLRRGRRPRLHLGVGG
jgi:hypothetical protein